MLRSLWQEAIQKQVQPVRGQRRARNYAKPVVAGFKAGNEKKPAFTAKGISQVKTSSLRSFHGRHERAGCPDQALQFMAARKSIHALRAHRRPSPVGAMRKACAAFGGQRHRWRMACRRRAKGKGGMQSQGLNLVPPQGLEVARCLASAPAL